MEKRVLLAVVLSFVVLYGYQALYPPPKPQPRQEPQLARLRERRRTPAPRSERGGGAAAKRCPSLRPHQLPTALVADTEEREIRVRERVGHARCSPRVAAR